MDFEWLRLITIILAIVALVQLLVFYRNIREPGIFALISWVLNVICYDIFKFIVDGDLNYYTVSVIWNNIIFIHGIIIIVVAIYVFRDVKSWIFKL